MRPDQYTQTLSCLLRPHSLKRYNVAISDEARNSRDVNNMKVGYDVHFYGDDAASEKKYFLSVTSVWHPQIASFRANAARVEAHSWRLQGGHGASSQEEKEKRTEKERKKETEKQKQKALPLLVLTSMNVSMIHSVHFPCLS